MAKWPSFVRSSAHVAGVSDKKGEFKRQRTGTLELKTHSSVSENCNSSFQQLFGISWGEPVCLSGRAASLSQIGPLNCP